MKKIKDPDKEARKTLEKMLQGGNTISRVARQLKVNKGLIPYVLHGGHSPTLLTALNLPVLEREVVEACAECGQIHVMHITCGKKKRHRVRYRKIVELGSTGEIEELEFIAEDNGFSSWSELCRHVARRSQLGSQIFIVMND